MEFTPRSNPIRSDSSNDHGSRVAPDTATRPELPVSTASTATTRTPSPADISAHPVSSITPPGSARLLDPALSDTTPTERIGTAPTTTPTARTHHAAAPTPAVAPITSPAASPDRLPLPADTAGLALRARLLRTFATGAWDQLTELIANARPLPLRTRLVAVWLPLAEALADERTAPAPRDTTGHSVIHRSSHIANLSANLRADIRMALAAFDDLHPELWLVPATAADETAAYLGALILCQRGHAARPWIWKVAPPGLAVVIAVNPSTAALPSGIFGRTTLAELCHQNGLA